MEVDILPAARVGRRKRRVMVLSLTNHLWCFIYWVISGGSINGCVEAWPHVAHTKASLYHSKLCDYCFWVGVGFVGYTVGFRVRRLEFFARVWNYVAGGRGGRRLDT